MYENLESVKKIINNCKEYALLFDNVPVGAALKIGDRIIYNSNQKDVHAEFLLLQNLREDADLFLTLEPCPSCAFQILKKPIKRLFFGFFNKEYGAFGGKFCLWKVINLPKPEIFGGLCENEDNYLLNFFKKKR